MENHTKVLKNVFYYSSSAYIAQILGIVSNIYVARLLGPENFGVWNIVMLVLTYGTYTELGVLSAMGRDLPLSLGQGDLDKVSTINSSARYATIFSSIVISITIFVSTYFHEFSKLMTTGLRAGSFILVLQQIYSYHRIYLRSYNNFEELSKQQIYFAVLTSFLSVVLVYIFGFNGRLWAGLLAYLTIITYALLKNPWIKNQKFAFKDCFLLMKIGIPIIISGLIITMLTSIDRLMVATFLDEKNLGYMSLSVMIVSIISVIPLMVSQVLLPKFNFLYGSSGMDIKVLKSYVFKTTRILSLIMPIVIGPLYIILPMVVNIFLLDYAKGVESARIVMIGFYFYAILGLSDSLLVTTGRLKLYGVFGVLALIVNVILDYIFIKLGYGIEGVAFAGTFITYFIYSTMLIGYAVSKFLLGIRESLIFFVKIWAPFIYMLLILFMIEHFFEYLLLWTNRDSHAYLPFLKLLSYLIFCIPLLFIALNELQFKMPLLKDKLFRYFNLFI